MLPPLVTLEEHFFSAAVGDSSNASYAEQLKHIPGLSEQLRDLSSRRLSDMSEGAVSLQVISHAPGAAALPLHVHVDANNQLAAAVAVNKERFAGFAVLPMGQPEDAARELHRCVKELGFVGALIDNHVDGTYYDDRKFWPVFAQAEALNVPIYIHPTWPAEELKDQYRGNFVQGAAASLGSSGWGWHADTALHVLKLFSSGLFDAYPRLKIILGHMGEMLPFQIERCAFLSKRWGSFDRDLMTVWNENIWITTSGMFYGSLASFACALQVTKIERILYSVDYPFASNTDGMTFMEKVRDSGMVNEEQFEMIAYKNAETLLGIKASRRT